MNVSMCSLNKPTTWSLLLAVLFLGTGLLAGCGGADDDANAADEDVAYQIGEPLEDSTYAAIVISDFGADTLTTAEFQAQYQRVARQVPQIEGDLDQKRELRRNIVEDFVIRHLLFGEADRLRLVADTARVEGQLRQLRSQFPNEDAFQQVLAANNLTIDSLRGSLQRDIRQQMLIEQMAESAEDPAEDELEAFRNEQAEQVSAQHILFLVNQGTEEAEVRAEAEAVLDSIQAGADFAEMARRHSEDGTASQGGDLGYFSRGQMVPAFEEAAFALSDSGDVTQELVRTNYGYHIIRLTGRRTGEPIDTARARQMMMRTRQQKAVEQGIAALRKKATVRLNDDIVQADLNESLMR